MGTRYLIMVKRDNGMMRITANKATLAEANSVAGTDGIVKKINTKRKKRK